MRELAYTEISGLKECLDELAAHHNEVSANFPGQYPKRPAEETLKGFEKDVLAGRSRIAVVESEGRILGFCKADLDGADGAVGYLIVRKSARGKGYGDLLLTWALETLKQRGAARIEVRVVDGNDAIGFYEKYGFRVCSHILGLNV